MTNQYRFLVTTSGKTATRDGLSDSHEVKMFVQHHDLMPTSQSNAMIELSDNARLEVQQSVPTANPEKPVFIGDVVSITPLNKDDELFTGLDKLLYLPKTSIPTNYDKLVLKLIHRAGESISGLLYFKTKEEYVLFGDLEFFQNKATMTPKRLATPRVYGLTYAENEVTEAILTHPNLKVEFNCTSPEWDNLVK